MLNPSIKFDFVFASKYPHLDKFLFRYAIKSFYKEAENYKYDLFIDTVKTEAFFINETK